MQRQIFRRNRREINRRVYGYTAEFKRYEREHKARVRTYQRRCSHATIDRSVAASDTVFVGDYHTLPQAQRGFLDLLEHVQPERSITIALEFVQGRHQKAVDDYLSGSCSEEDFLAHIGHQTHWLAGGWPSFKRIFDFARQRGVPVLAIDAASGGEAGSSLARRDRYAARRLAKIRRDRPSDLIFVLIGDLHVAPRHLPARMLEQLGDAAAKERQLIIYQNAPSIYEALEERGLEHDTEIVRLSQREYCLINALPIVCQQSFLNWLEVDDEMQPVEAIEDNFRRYGELIASFFGLPIGGALDDVEVATVLNLDFLSSLQRRGGFSDYEMKQVNRQILASQSYYIPAAGIVYLANLSINHASEEASHFLRHRCSGGSGEPRYLVDAFYARVLEEAVGFLGSKLLNHKRRCSHASDLRRLARRQGATSFTRRLASLANKHERLVAGLSVRKASSIYECGQKMFNAITHVIGYQLGDRLYFALLDGDIAKTHVRKLFFESFADEGAAIGAYFGLMKATEHANVPKPT